MLHFNNTISPKEEEIININEKVSKIKAEAKSAFTIVREIFPGK